MIQGSLFILMLGSLLDSRIMLSILQVLGYIYYVAEAQVFKFIIPITYLALNKIVL